MNFFPTKLTKLLGVGGGECGRGQLPTGLPGSYFIVILIIYNNVYSNSF